MWRVFILPVREMNNPIHSPRQPRIRVLAHGPRESSRGCGTSRPWGALGVRAAAGRAGRQRGPNIPPYPRAGGAEHWGAPP